ncbi:MAG: hydroxyacid dehydrogenase [candidate division Zixibacteria bacterium]|nr:hydroxyacid dehydrogenase [candidate division Zixibacteria bacterium]
MMLIFIADAFDSSLPSLLKKYGEVTDDKNKLPEAEIALVRSKTKVTRDFIDKAEKLKMVIRGGVGMDTIDIDYAHQKNIITHNTADASTVAVAELAFAFMIALPNNITKADRSIREGKWLKTELTRTELGGKTLGILGMGRIGTALAIRARAFRMKLLAWHPDVRFSDFAEIRTHLEDVLPESDYVSLHTPLVESTRGLINKKTLALFKTGAYLINTGRGECIVEQDVADALKSGKLGGFANDVWHKEPPENSPLFDAPNTILAPHIGASTKENLLRIGTVIDRLIDEYVAHIRKG